LRVIIDTSFLLLLVERGKDLLRLMEDKFGERVEPLVPRPVVRELERLASLGGRRGHYAGLALKIAAGMEGIGGEGDDADEAILRLFHSTRLPVVTADSGLARRLRRLGGVIIYVNRKLEMHASF